MKTCDIGWEVMNLDNGGVNYTVTFDRDIKLHKLQIDTAIGFPRSWSNLFWPFGFSEVYTAIYLMNGQPQVASGQDYVSGPFDSTQGDFSVVGFNNPKKFATGGGCCTHGGQLFASILKGYAPYGVNRSNLVELNGLVVPAKNTLVFHVDGMGRKCDFEMQGAIFYE